MCLEKVGAEFQVGLESVREPSLRTLDLARELRRDNANDGNWLTVERNNLPDNTRICCEAIPPESFTQDYNRPGRRTVIVFEQTSQS